MKYVDRVVEVPEVQEVPTFQRSRADPTQLSFRGQHIPAYVVSQITADSQILASEKMSSPPMSYIIYDTYSRFGSHGLYGLTDERILHT